MLWHSRMEIITQARSSICSYHEAWWTDTNEAALRILTPTAIADSLFFSALVNIWNKKEHWYKWMSTIHCTSTNDVKQEEQMLKRSSSAILTPWNVWAMVFFMPFLQQNECASSSFPGTVWPWVKVKVIQNGIKVPGSVVSSMVPSLKKLWVHKRPKAD